jgi:HTH-type transcriptional regulator/antitoxin HigA
MTERIPAEAFPPGEFIADEMQARGWTHEDVAARMGGAEGKERLIDALTVQAICEQWVFPDDPNPEIGPETAAKLGRAFDADPEYFLNLDRIWRSYVARKLLAAGGYSIDPQGEP